jgi:CheY-like chemotaxis protein
VLVVDDDPVARELACGVLASLGHAVETVPTSAAARAACRERWFDLVLLDLRLPDADGLATATDIRRGGSQNAEVRLVALTGGTPDGDPTRCLAAGMDAYLAKPLRRDVLGHTLDAFFGAPPAAGDETPVDVGALLEEVRGDMALLRRLVVLFHEQSARLLADGRRAIDRGDRRALDGAAHALKSVIGHFSTGVPFEHAREVEALARGGQLGEVRERWRLLEHDVEAIGATLDTLAAEPRR